LLAIEFLIHSQEAAVPVKKSRLPEEEEEEEREGGKQQAEGEDDDDEDALKKARDFDDFKDGNVTRYTHVDTVVIP
jgi:hypothetical protein